MPPQKHKNGRDVSREVIQTVLLLSIPNLAYKVFSHYRGQAKTTKKGILEFRLHTSAKLEEDCALLQFKKFHPPMR